MTNFSKSVVASVVFALMSTAASALTPVGEVFTPEGASENSQYWQKFTAEKGDFHWSYAARFLDEANLREKVKGVTSGGVYFPAEAVVMGAIEVANGAEKFDGDNKGYPTFKVGETYLLPVPTAKGYVVPPVPATQAELRAQMKQLEERYAQLQPVSKEAYDSMFVQVQVQSSLLGTMGDQLAEVATTQEALQQRFDGLATEQSVTKETVAKNTAGLETLTSDMELFADQQRTDVNQIDQRLSEVQAELNTANLNIAAAQTAAESGQVMAEESFTLATNAARDATLALEGVMQAGKQNTRATAVTSNRGLLIVAGLVLLTILLVAGLFHWFFGRKIKQNITDVVAAQSQTTADVVVLRANVETQGKQLEGTTKVASNAAMLAENTRASHETLADDVATMMPTQANDIMPDKDNLTHDQLAELMPATGRVDYPFTDQSTGQRYNMVQFWRTESTPAGQVESNILRNVKSGKLIGSMNVKKIPGNLARAISAGRLPSQPSDEKGHMRFAAE